MTDVWEEDAEEDSWTEEVESSRHPIVPYDGPKAFSKASFPQSDLMLPLPISSTLLFP